LCVSNAGSGRVLVVEDDRETRESLRFALSLAGYEVVTAGDGEAALRLAGESFDTIVLDVSLPFVDGLSVCRFLRGERNRTPVLMVSARVEVSDRVAGLDAGADDYLVKPYAVPELLARVRALTRRLPGEEPNGTVDVGELHVDGDARRAELAGRELNLTRTEFDLLELLARNVGVVLPHGVIYERIWGYDFGPDSKNLAVYVGYLRRKLESQGGSDLIQTVRGIGYVLRPPRLRSAGSEQP
jgi:two-component system, OmpR family, response regulator MprA